MQQKRELPEGRLVQNNIFMTYTHRYEFFLCPDGELFARDKNRWRVTREWKPLLDFKPHKNMPAKLLQIIKDKQIHAITADESNLHIIDNEGQVYYGKLDTTEAQIEWEQHWGLVNLFTSEPRTIYANPKRFKFVSASHSPPYKGRPDGLDKIQGTLEGISSLGAYDTYTGYICYSDAWWKSTFSQMIYPPNGVGVLGMGMSASHFAIVGSDKSVYTILKDFDTGDNLAFRHKYSLAAMENNLHPGNRPKVDFTNYVPANGISFRMIKDLLKERNLPYGTWQNHPLPEGFRATGSIAIRQNGRNVRDDFKLRVWGYQGERYGYIIKPLVGNVDEWKFYRRSKKFDPEQQDTPLEVSLPVSTPLAGKLGFWGRSTKHHVELTIDSFNPYKDFNRVTVNIAGQKYPLHLFLDAHVYVGSTIYAKATLMLSTELRSSVDPHVVSFIKDYFGRNDDVQTFLIKMNSETGEIGGEKLRYAHPSKPLVLRLAPASRSVESLIPKAGRVSTAVVTINTEADPDENISDEDTFYSVSL